MQDTNILCNNNYCTSTTTILQFSIARCTNNCMCLRFCPLVHSVSFFGYEFVHYSLMMQFVIYVCVFTVIIICMYVLCKYNSALPECVNHTL